jgi:hypothetical protein
MMDGNGISSCKNLIAGCSVAAIEPGNFVQYRFNSAAPREYGMSNGPLIPTKFRGQGENGNIPYHIEMVRKAAESTVGYDSPNLILQTHDFRKCMNGVLITMIKMFGSCSSINPYINEP